MNAPERPPGPVGAAGPARPGGAAGSASPQGPGAPVAATRVVVPGPFYRTPSDSRSLFGELLDWVLAPLLFLWPMSLALTWGVAQNIANRPYDRELVRLTQTLAAAAEVRPAQPIHLDGERAEELQRIGATLVRTDDDDAPTGDASPGPPESAGGAAAAAPGQRWFQVLGSRGELLAGEPLLVVPAGSAAATVRIRDDSIGDEPVRVAWLWLAGGESGGASLVQVAETLDNRQRLATEIIKGVLLPQFTILPVAVVLLWLALRRGIKPLNELQQRIRRRESGDLSPIPDRDIPDEVAPLVRAINELLSRLDKSIATQRHFLADAAHQLKTPLAGLRTQAELAAREIDAGRVDPATARHSLRQIAVASQRAAHMVNQLLAMARAEDGGEQLRRQWVDLGAITRSVVRDFVPRAMERRIDLGYEGPEGALDGDFARLHAEPVLLGEMVRNLIDNALHYTPPGGTVTVRVLPDPGGRMVVLQVEDTGPGIPPAERELVFRPFYRALGTQVDGSGLGLAIVQEVVQRHGGSIAVDDAKPRRGVEDELCGALFTVRLARESMRPA